MTTIAYLSNATITPAIDCAQMLGAYKIVYGDGVNVLLPHIGYAGTISAEPLDPTDPEHRRVLLRKAEPARRELLNSR